MSIQYSSIRSMSDTLKFELETNSAAVVKYLDLLYRLQTDSEQKDSILRTKNNVGFTRNDSKRLTILAKESRESGLNADEVRFLQSMLPKYAPQIIKVLLSNHSIEKLRRGCYIW